MEKVRKSFNKRFRRLRHRHNIQPQNYQIVTEFENKTEKECSKIDEENMSMYNNLLSKSRKAYASIKNSGLQMTLEVPPPPSPNNRDRYILWRKRNVSEKVIPQSEAVYFLTKNGFELDKDYEAYQAIGLADQIMRQKGIEKSREDKSKDFTNVFTSTDNNLLRKFSTYGMTEYNTARSIINTNLNNNTNIYDNRLTRSYESLNSNSNNIISSTRYSYPVENVELNNKINEIMNTNTNTITNTNTNMRTRTHSVIASAPSNPPTSPPPNPPEKISSNQLYPKIN